MQARHKVVVFIALVFVVLIVGIFAGDKLTAIGGGIVGIVGSIIAVFSGKRGDTESGISTADAELETANRAHGIATGGMDSVSREGEGIRESGERLVNTGDGLVESSKSLIEEARRSSTKGT